ncbi:cardiolipin synthase [Pseudodesulfovibrio tunisiensis]|uniref:cardiolipin synthase n=1 Tax=Pseudodesulfovibrio tunisiensis TaxID=463192 RepID=UPI001FB24A99|nr:cardiolipin synthase [Pseudodesulfovibrio tunisiensis]
MVGGVHNIPAPLKPSERRNPHAPRCVFESLAGLPFIGGNDLELLVDGKATFQAIFRAVRKAEKYVLVQFFIVHDDEIGRRFKTLLMAKASQGVRVHFLYDEIGCHSTPAAYWEELRAAGVDVRPFHTRKGRGNRFQLNFRNHRKIVVVDGHTAFVGGHNVGDEYLGLDERFGHWRDTHVRCSGPAVLGVQVSYAKDWYWAAHELLRLNWSHEPRPGGADVLALGTGPGDKLESCSLMYVRAINASRDRIWIASPYFVPDSPVLKALQLAALRGVDVRIMIPEKPDHKIVYWAGFSSLKELDLPGVRVFRYADGFLHQKVFLVDNCLAGVGTANLDNRSFRLNFEITLLVENESFCNEIEQMMKADFNRCIEVGPSEFDDKNAAYKMLVRCARLLAPVL